jgi:hypothetical protein
MVLVKISGVGLRVGVDVRVDVRVIVGVGVTRPPGANESTMNPKQ